MPKPPNCQTAFSDKAYFHSAMTFLLEARNIRRRHPDRRSWLLEDISLTIRQGERIALTGPSGSGKTLLLRALVLLDPVDSGEIRWHGRGVRGEMMPAFRGQAIYMHQRPAFNQTTVEAALRLPFELSSHRGKRFDRGLLLEYLRRLGRDGSFLSKSVRDLSGGERQLASLLRAIQLDPAVLLLDEPTAALDKPTAGAVEELISRWIDEDPQNRTFIWVGHDEAQARRITRRSIAIRDGRLVDESSPRPASAGS